MKSERLVIRKKALYEPFKKKPKVREELRGKSPKSEGPSGHIPQSSPGPGAGTVTISKEKGSKNMAGKRMIRRAGPSVMDKTLKSIPLAGGGFLNARVINDADPEKMWQWEFEIVKDGLAVSLSVNDVESLGSAAEEIVSKIEPARGASKKAGERYATEVKVDQPQRMIRRASPPAGEGQINIPLDGGAWLSANVVNDADPQEMWQWEFAIGSHKFTTPLKEADLESMGAAAQDLLVKTQDARSASKKARRAFKKAKRMVLLKKAGVDLSQVRAEYKGMPGPHIILHGWPKARESELTDEILMQLGINPEDVLAFGQYDDDVTLDILPEAEERYATEVKVDQPQRMVLHSGSK